MKPTRILTLLAMVLAAAVLPASIASADMLVRGYQAVGGLDPRYDRFANSSEFIGAGLDFSGVGQDSTVPEPQRRWATMISPHFFLSSRHYVAGGTVTFYDGNSQTNGHPYTILGGSATYVQGQTLPTDIFVGILGSEVSQAYYPLLDPNLISVGQSLLVYGKPNRLGTSTISAIEELFDLQTLDSHNNIVTISQQKGFDFVYDVVGNPGDAALVSGDSGAPSFVRVGNQLVLAGLHAGSDYSLTAPPPYMSTDTCPSFYIDEINALMASLAVQHGVGAGEQVTVMVPEPSALVLLGIAAVGLIGCGWRRGRRIA